MPTVPYISQPRVAPNALPGPNLSPNVPQGAFRGAAQNLPDLSGVTKVAEGEMEARHKIALEEAYQADQVAVTHAVSRTQNDVNDWMNGPDGLLRRKGKNAFTIDQEAYDKYGALVSDVRSQLTNDRQRAVYDKYVMNGWDSIQSQVVPHIAQQREAFDKEGVDSLITAHSNALLAAPLNPVVVEQAITASQAAKTAWLQRQGADDDTIKNAQADIASGARMDVLKSMLNSTIPNRDQMAASYYEKYKSQFVGKDALDAERLAKTSLLEGDALRATDKIIATTPSESAADAEIDKQIDDPVLREKAKAHLSAVYNRRDGMVRADQQRAYEAGATILHSHGNDITAVSEVQRQAMGEAHYQNLEAEAWRLNHTRDLGNEEGYNFHVNMANLNPDAFNQVDIPALRKQGYSESQVSNLLTLQRGTLNRDIRQQQSDLQRDLSSARSNELHYKRLAEKAESDGDTEARDRYEAQRVDANKMSTMIQSDLTVLKQRARGTPIPATPPAFPPTASTSPTAPLTVPGKPSESFVDRLRATQSMRGELSAPPTTSSAPLALTPLKPPTDSMLVDIAVYGPGYAAVLRSHGFNAPDHVTLPPTGKPTEKKPTVSKTTVKRGPDGKITDTTTTITKPED